MILKQPKGLPILFLTEMWERFGFYIVQGLLILYMTSAFKFSDSKGFSILGAFTALLYITPVLGGLIGDRILGFCNNIIIGSLFFIGGYALLMTSHEQLFYVALAIIVVGNGFFKPSISTLLGSLYEKDDPRREGGFTIFYMGINLGVLLATTTVGFIKEKFGWHAAFGAASIGLTIALITFLYGLKYLNQYGGLPKRSVNFSRMKQYSNIAIGILLVAIIAWLLIQHALLANWILFGGSAVLGFYLILEAFRREQMERNKFLALIVLIVTAIIFWAIFFQLFFSTNLFIDREVNRNLFGIQIPTVMFLGLEAFFIFLLGPIFAYLWYRLNKMQLNISISLKFALATLIIGIAFLWLVLGIKVSGTHLVNPIWIVLSYLFITIGELLLSPIGLSMVTTLAPKNLIGMMMGVWFVALGLGGKLAGVIAKIASIPAGVTNHQLMLNYYANAFSKYAILGVGVGILILMLTPFLRKMEQGRNPF